MTGYLVGCAELQGTRKERLTWLHMHMMQKQAGMRAGITHRCAALELDPHMTQNKPLSMSEWPSQTPREYNSPGKHIESVYLKPVHLKLLLFAPAQG